MARRILPFVPVSLLLRHRFDSRRKIAKIHCPTLIGHGRDDDIVPFAMGEKLAKAAAGPVTTLWIDGAEHNDFFDFGGRRIDEAVAKFVEGTSPSSTLDRSCTVMLRSSCFKASVIRRKTPSQSPNVVCRNTLMVGYHGLSSRPAGQRHSLTEERATQTGTPRPPARWATAVSAVITRSRWDMIEAVSMKSRPRRPVSSVTGKRPAKIRELIQAMDGLQADQPDARQLGDGCEVASGNDRQRSVSWAGFPCQAIPIRNGRAGRPCQVGPSLESAPLSFQSTGPAPNASARRAPDRWADKAPGPGASPASCRSEPAGS